VSEDDDSEDSEDLEGTKEPLEIFDQEENPRRSGQARRSTDVVEEESVDSRQLDECPDLSDYEKDLLRLSYIEHKGPTEIGKLYGKDKSTVVPQRDRAYEKYVNWVQTGREAEEVSRRNALEETVAQDPEVRKVHAAIHDLEARRDKAKALLEAKEREKQVKEEALEYEAILNPIKIAAYLKEVMTKSNLPEDQALAFQFEWLVWGKGLSAKNACVEAVRSFGKSYDEWQEEERNSSEFEGEPSFNEYLRRVFWRWVYSNHTMDCRCPQCRKRLTIETDEEGRLTRLTCSSERCREDAFHGARYNVCPVCRHVDSEENLMVYLPQRKTFYCKYCNVEINAHQPPLIKGHARLKFKRAHSLFHTIPFDS